MKTVYILQENTIGDHCECGSHLTQVIFEIDGKQDEVLICRSCDEEYFEGYKVNYKTDYPQKIQEFYSRYDYPRSDETYSEMIGKDLLFFDQHHGSALMLKNAQMNDILRLDDDKTNIIVLCG